MVGEILNGRYEILKSVGFGGMAEVYLAKDVLLDRKIAVKVLRKKFLDSKAQLDQFKREARSAARLIHPSIVTIYDVCDAGDISYILMEYVEGVSLKAFEEQNGRMDPALAVALTAQLASALDHAHKHNIIHCDIKPQNIVLTESMVPKIVDFGISRIVSNETMAFTASVVGSVHYFSPEQAQGLTITAQSDIYSLGIVFYEMLTGKVPFDGNNAVSVARMQVEDEAPPLRTYWPEAPEALQRIVDKALAKKLEDRYATAEEMKNDLMELKNRMYPSKNNVTFLENTIPLQAITNPKPVKAAVSEPVREMSKRPEDKYQTLIMHLPSFLTEDEDDTSEYERIEKPESTRKVEAVSVKKETPAQASGIKAAAAAGAVAAGASVSAEQQSLFTDDPETDVPDADTDGKQEVSSAEDDVEVNPGRGNIIDAQAEKPAPAVITPAVLPVAEPDTKRAAETGPVFAAANTGRETPVVSAGPGQAGKGAVAGRSVNKQEEKPKKKSSVLGTILKILLVLILLAGAAIFYFFGASKPDFVVPDVNGKTVAEAQQLLTEKGFKVKLEDVVDKNVKPGLVMRMDPVAGAKRKEGATITLIVASAEQMAEVPRIAGLQQDQAEKLLADKKLRIEKIDQKWDSTKPEGLILSQSPEAGSKLPENGGVNIIVNKKEEKNVAVPDVTGMKLAEAKKTLEDLKLKVDVKEVDSDRERDVVISTQPVDGSTLTEGETVTLQVSNAKKKISFPATPENIGNGPQKPSGSVTVSQSTGSRYVEFVVPGTGSHTIQIVSNNGASQKIEVSGSYNGGVRLRTKVDSDVKRVGFYVDNRLVEEKSW